MNIPRIAIVIPVYNEEKILAQNTKQVAAFLEANCSSEWQIVIAENGSTDQTLAVARGLESQLPHVRVSSTTKRGRGRALKSALAEAPQEILTYMDIDLATDLSAFGALVGPLLRGTSDVVSGSRHLSHSKVVRSFKRDFISRMYNRLIRLWIGTQISDAQCGFKGLTKQAATELLPLVEDDQLFMDTELLLLGEALGYRIIEIPVTWTEGTTSHISVLKTAIADIRGLLRLRPHLKELRGSLRGSRF